jgi:hypothetical protein
VGYADDPLAIQRAEEWLYSELSPDAGGDDRFPTAVALAITLRQQFDLCELTARKLVEDWTWFACTPKLEQSDIERAMQVAYSAALKLVVRTDGWPVEPPGARATLPANREKLTTELGRGPAGVSAVDPGRVDAAPVGPPAKPKDRTGAERQKRYRERRKAAGVTPDPITAEAVMPAVTNTVTDTPATPTVTTNAMGGGNA